MRPLFASSALLAGAFAFGALWLFAGREPAATGPLSDFGHGVGEMVPDLELEPVDGPDRLLSQLLEGAPALVVAMRDASCPVGSKYGPRLARLEEELGREGVPFVYLNVNAGDDAGVVREEELGRFGFEGPYVLDPDGEGPARALRPRTTTEVFLIDRTRTLRYRGAVDDQYGIDFAKPEPGEHWLRDAAAAVLAGRDVERRETFPSGCVLEAGSSMASGSASGSGGAASVAAAPADRRSLRPVTYHNRVSRIVQENCVGCHRDGGVAPFALDSYEQLHAYRHMVRYMVEEERMPPWFAGDGGTGVWANARGLSDRDRADLLAWIDAEAPAGDRDDGPTRRSFEPGWNIGAPDAVLTIPRPYEVPAEGVVDYQYMYLKTDFPEDRWIQRMEIRPGAPQVVHHVLVLVEEPEARRPREGADGFFAVHVPGSLGNVYPEGRAKKLPAGAWLKFQLHYTPNGTAVEDLTRIGFVFADGPPEEEVETASALNQRIRIPPHAPDHREVATYRFRDPGRLLTLFPHMHVRGKAFRYELVYPDGSEEVVLDIPRYDFNWQVFYQFEEPKPVPAGTVLRATGWFDNSEGNPANPDPSAEVRFGEQTFEEMLIGYFDWVRDAEGAAAVGAGAAGAAGG